MTKWSPVIPGTNIDRVDIIVTARSAYQERIKYGRIDENQFNKLARAGVLSIIQIADIYGWERQSVYVRFWKAGIELPKHTARGRLEPKYLEILELAVKAKRLGKPVPPPIRDELRIATSPSLLEHLTGIQVAGGL